MIQLPLPNKNFIEPISKLSQTLDRNSLSMVIYDSGNIKVGDKLLIGSPGQDQSSDYVVSDVSGQKIYINPGTKYSYPSDTAVSRIYWKYYISEISYDGGWTWIPLSTGEIPYSKGYIGISKVPFYPSANPQQESPKIRFKYYVSCNPGKNNIEETEWFDGSSNPYVTTMVGNVDDSKIRMESLIKSCQSLYGNPIDTDVWLFWFNDLLNKLHIFVNKVKTDTDKGKYTFVTTPKIGTYYLPFETSRITEIRSPKSFRIARYEDCSYVLRMRDSTVHSEAGCLDDCYFPEGNRYLEFKILPTYELTRDAVVLDPVPMHAYTIVVDYLKLPLRFTYENPSIEIESMHENMFIYYALYNQFTVNGDARSRWALDQYNDAKLQFKSYVINRPINKGDSGSTPTPLSHNYTPLGRGERLIR